MADKYRGHHPWLGHGDVGGPLPEPNALDRAIKKGDRLIQKGVDYAKAHAGQALNALAPGGRKLVTKAVGSLADIALDASPAGAGSDNIPAPSKRQMKNVDNSGLTKEKLP